MTDTENQKADLLYGAPAIASYLGAHRGCGLPPGASKEASDFPHGADDLQPQKHPRRQDRRARSRIQRGMTGHDLATRTDLR